MKPPPFTYHRPATVADALAVLAEVGADGKVLAGGQSLVPVLNMRLAAPGHLVDVNRLAELSYGRCAPEAVRGGAPGPPPPRRGGTRRGPAPPPPPQRPTPRPPPADRPTGATTCHLLPPPPAGP